MNGGGTPEKLESDPDLWSEPGTTRSGNFGCCMHQQTRSQNHCRPSAVCHFPAPPGHPSTPHPVAAMGKKGKKAQAGKPKKLTPKDAGKRLSVLVKKLDEELKGADTVHSFSRTTTVL